VVFCEVVYLETHTHNIYTHIQFTQFTHTHIQFTHASTLTNSLKLPRKRKSRGKGEEEVQGEVVKAAGQIEKERRKEDRYRACKNNTPKRETRLLIKNDFSLYF
jgi:hypothetical protein